MNTFLAILTAFLFLLGPSANVKTNKDHKSAASDPATIIVVRHAEKIDNSSDPDLSEAGLERAKQLANMLRSMQVEALYSTPYKRTRQTLGVLAENLGLSIEEYDPRNPNATLEKLKSAYGKTIVIAGHSNTAPSIVNFLSEKTVYKELEDHQYDHMWIVQCYPDGTTNTILLHY